MNSSYEGPTGTASPTVAELRAVCRKGPRDPYWLSHYLWRPVSIYGTWLFIRLHATSTHVTLLSLVAGVAGSLCFIWRTPMALVAGLILVQLWYYLDHVDGELARYERTCKGARVTPAGAYFDSVVHRYVTPLTFFCLGKGLDIAFNHNAYGFLGFMAAFAYMGFARTEACSILLSYHVREKGSLDDPAVRKIVSLMEQTPSMTVKRDGIDKWVAWARHIKPSFASPGYLVALIPILLIDMALDTPPAAWGIPWNATAVFLLLQALMGLAQCVVGTWHVFRLLSAVGRSDETPVQPRA